MDRIKYMQHCLEAEVMKGFSARAQTVFMALIVRAEDGSGEVHFSARDLAQKLSTTPRSVSAALDDLEWLGLLKRERQRGVAGTLIFLTWARWVRVQDGPEPAARRWRENRARWQKYLGLDMPPGATQIPVHCARLMARERCPAANWMNEARATSLTGSGHSAETETSVASAARKLPSRPVEDDDKDGAPRGAYISNGRFVRGDPSVLDVPESERILIHSPLPPPRYPDEEPPP